MWLFKRNKHEPVTETATAKPVIRYPVDSLLNKEAAWGGSFRTITFTGVEDGPLAWQFNLQAIRTASRHWTVLRITTNKAAPQGAVRTTEVEKSELRFLQALDHLASFEATERLGNIPAIEGEKASLGFEHYQAFGEREGLIFDQQGMPHETHEGAIITEGEFTSGDLSSFEKNYRQTEEEKRASKARQAGETHLALMQAFSGTANAGLTDFPGGMVKQSDFDEVMARLRKRDGFTALKQQMKTAIYWWNRGLEYGFKDVAYSIENSLKEGENLLPSFEEDVSILTRGLKICRFAAKMQQAQQEFHYKAKGPTSEAGLRELKRECEKVMQELSIPNADEITASLMLQSFDKPPAAIPAFVLEFDAQIKKAEEILTDQARQLAQGHTQALNAVSGQRKLPAGRTMEVG